MTESNRTYREPIIGNNGDIVCRVYDTDGKRYLEFENMDKDGEYVSVTVDEFMEMIHQARKKMGCEKQ